MLQYKNYKPAPNEDATEKHRGLMTADHAKRLNAIGLITAGAASGTVSLTSPTFHTIVDARESTYLCSNCYYDGTAWQRYNTGRTASAVTLSWNGVMKHRFVAAGANPIVWTETTMIYGGDSGWIAHGGFSNSYRNYAGGVSPFIAHYRKLPNGMVVMRGILDRTGTASTTGEVMFVMPVGYRPGPGVQYLFTSAMYVGGPTYGEIRIDEAGNAIYYGPNATQTYISLAGISYLAEQ